LSNLITSEFLTIHLAADSAAKIPKIGILHVSTPAATGLLMLCSRGCYTDRVLAYERR